VRVRVTPKAREARIEGLYEDAAGGVRLRVAVTEAADAGRANAAVLALLAREWRLPKTTLAVVSGATDRRKTISIEGDSGTLMDRLLRWGETERWRSGK
jgi:uncharacterized protein YggU (UPF0235/DUF167 family)